MSLLLSLYSDCTVQGTQLNIKLYNTMYKDYNFDISYSLSCSQSRYISRREYIESNFCISCSLLESVKHFKILLHEISLSTSISSFISAKSSSRLPSRSASCSTLSISMSKFSCCVSTAAELLGNNDLSDQTPVNSRRTKTPIMTVSTLTLGSFIIALMSDS